jgi:hypothetical protein
MEQRQGGQPNQARDGDTACHRQGLVLSVYDTPGQKQIRR